MEGECSCIQVSVLREISSCEYEIEFAFALKAALLLLYVHVGALCTFQAGNGYKWASIIHVGAICGRLPCCVLW